MKQQIKVAVVIPVGPLGSSYTLEQLYDTVESVIHNADPSRMIVIQDSSAPLYVGRKVKERYPEVIVNFSPEHYGQYGGIFMADTLAFTAVHNFFDYQLLVRMDIDAMWAARGLEDEMIEYLKVRDKVGILAGLSEDKAEADWQRRMIRRQRSLLGLFSNPKRYFMLNRLIQGAQGNGWKKGDHVRRGAMIINPAFIQKLTDQRLLLRNEIRSLKLHENHIYPLLCRFAGMEVENYGFVYSGATTNPDHRVDTPEALVNRGGKLIHSVRQWQGTSEDEVRSYFRAQREKAPAAHPVPPSPSDGVLTG